MRDMTRKTLAEECGEFRALCIELVRALPGVERAVRALSRLRKDEGHPAP